MVESCVAPTIVGLPTYFVRFVPTFCPRNYLPVYIPYRRVTRPIYYRDAEEISTDGRVGRGGEDPRETFASPSPEPRLVTGPRLRTIEREIKTLAPTRIEYRR